MFVDGLEVRRTPKISYEAALVLCPTLSFGFQFVADVVRLRRKRSKHRLSSCVRILTNSATHPKT